MNTNFSLSPQSWSTTAEAPSNANTKFYPLPPEIAILFSIIDGMAIVVGATTNLLVMAVIAKHHRMLKNMDLLIFNLCFSDFLISVFFQPLIIMRLLAKDQSSQIETLLRTMAAFTFLSAGCSSMFLVTLDRYVSIRHPFRYPSFVDKPKVYVCIGCVWVFSWAIGGCCNFDIKIAFRIYLVYISIIISFTITLQILAFRIAKTHEARIRQLQQSVSHNYRAPDVRMSSDERRKNFAQMNATKTIIILFVVYVGSWLPATLFRIYYGMKQDHKTFFSSINVINVAIQLHACVNPFIYVLRTRRVKTKFLRFKEEVAQSTRCMDSSSVGSVS